MVPHGKMVETEGKQGVFDRAPWNRLGVGLWQVLGERSAETWKQVRREKYAPGQGEE